MSGRLRSKRCQRCRRRKIKCDEDWPCCGQCARSKASCSGPPVGARFHLPGSTIADHDFAPQILSPTGRTIATRSRTSQPHLFLTTSSPSQQEHIYEQDTVPVATCTGAAAAVAGYPIAPEASNAFDFTQIHIPAPRTDPTTTAERVSARLISYLDKTLSYDASLAACYLHLLPSRIPESPALRDAVALFNSCWGNARRAGPSHKLMDIRAYGKSLRSLNRALDDPTLRFKTETLAATSLLDRVELMFDPRRPFGRLTHAKGITSLMETRGPPDSDDDLDVCLAFQNQASMFHSWFMDGHDYLLDRPEWKNKMVELITSKSPQVPSYMLDEWSLDQDVGCWAEVGLNFAKIEAELKGTENYEPSLRDLRRIAQGIRSKLSTAATRFREESISMGKMSEWPDPESVFGSRWSYINVDTLQYYMMFMVTWLIVDKTIGEISMRLNEPEAVPRDEIRCLCMQVWKSLRYMRSIGPIGGALFMMVLCATIEPGTPEERDVIYDTILDMDKLKQRLPTDKAALERILITNVDCITGKDPSILATHRKARTMMAHLKAKPTVTPPVLSLSSVEAAERPITSFTEIGQA